MPLLDFFWSLLWIFLFVLWIWLVISVFIDIFRSEMSGVAKALWVLFVLVIPLIGVLIYLIVHGGDMQERAVKTAQDQEAATRAYIQAAAGSGGTADELAKLAALRDKGVLTEEEFQAQKAVVLA